MLIRHGSLAQVATAIALVVAVAAGYVVFVARYAVNGVYMDEWNWVELLNRSYAGTLSLGDLWTQHNENREFFAEAIMLGVGRASAFSDVALIYLGVAFLTVTVVLLAIACRAELLLHPLVYVPAAFLLFSLAQYENALFSVQFGIFLDAACIAGALLLLTGDRIQAWRFGIAVALGVVASYTQAPGVTIWAAGFLALLRPGVSLRVRIAWIVAAGAVCAFYLHDLNFVGLGLSPIWTRLPSAIEGFLVTVGSVAPDPTLVTQPRPDFFITAVFGLVIVIAGSLVVASWILHGRGDRVLTIAAALVVAGLLFDAMLALGPLGLGPVVGTTSRYTTFNLLLLTGTYVGGVRTLTIAWSEVAPRPIAMRGVFAGLALVLVCIQVPVATRGGLLGGTATNLAHMEAANLTANYATAPPILVSIYAYPPSYEYFQAQAAFLQAQHLNVFSDGESTAYESSGVVSGGAVTSILPVPAELDSIRSSATQWRAWLALSSVYDQRPDLREAFPGPTMQASRQMVYWAVNNGIDPSADPVSAGVLQQYWDVYYAWLGQPGASGSAFPTLPIPPEFTDVQSGGAEWRAWLALSLVYDRRPDLKQAFPGRTVATSRQMLGWAVGPGSDLKADPVNGALLQPYLVQYKAWLGQVKTH